MTIGPVKVMAAGPGVVMRQFVQEVCLVIEYNLTKLGKMV